MNGFVNKLYDVDSIKIPEDMLEISVEDNCGDEAVKQLSLRYAEEVSADISEVNDIVYCAGDKDNYPDKRTLMIFTGSDIPGAEKAREAVLNKKVGDVVETALADKNVTLTVNKIVRRIPVKVDDNLIAGLGIEGVETVDAYKDHVTAQALENLKMETVKMIDGYIVKEMLEGCQFTYDEKEMDEYARETYDEYVNMYGEEEVGGSFEQVKPSIVDNIKMSWMAEAFCKSRNIEIDMSAIEEETDQMIEMMTLAGEEVPDREEMIQMTAQSEYTSQLFSYLESKTAEKIGG